MKFNNTYNLPGPLVAALQKDDYDLKNPSENVISLTTMIDSPRIKILEVRHDHEIEIDVTEQWWKVLGTAFHKVMENATGVLHMAEMRWFMEIETKKVFVTSGRPEQEPWYMPARQYVSGKIDLYSPEEKKLTDYKLTSVWSWLLEKDIKAEHDAQAQVNGLALRIIGHSVKFLSVLMAFRDWSETKNGAELPVPFKEIPTSLWNDESIFEYIGNRVKLHYDARSVSDDEIPECTPEERWTKPTVYAVMKPGRKSSVKNFDLRPTADQMREYPGCTITERPGEETRCIKGTYCNVRKWCKHYQNVYGVKNVPVEETY